jgi:dihydroflavonol-4-reductase
VQKAVAQGLDAVIVNPTLVFGPGDIYRQGSSLITQVAKRG